MKCCWVVCVVVSAGLGLAAHAQATYQMPSGPGAEGVRGGATANNPGFSPYSQAPFQSHATDPKEAAAERQKKIEDDTAKVRELSVELQEAIRKSGPNQLSLDAIKKAQEIERLAKEIRVLLRQ